MTIVLLTQIILVFEFQTDHHLLQNLRAKLDFATKFSM